MARDFKIELDNVEMVNGSDDLLKDMKVTKVTLTGENKLNSLNSTFENCTELTTIEGDINLEGVSDMTEMALNTSLGEVKVINPTEETIQATDSLKQVSNVKIGGTKYSKGGVQDVVGSLDWDTENFTYEDTILENVYTNSSNIIDNKSITIQDTLEQKATSFEVVGQTYMNLVEGKKTKTLLDEMSTQKVEYECVIAPNTLYTIQFNCIEKSNTNITLDLGGSRVIVDPIIGVNHVKITTPSELTSYRLFMIGTGIKIKEVIVNKGEMNQFPIYFDGEQSVGELQEDDTYNITIHTDNYSSRWEEL